MTRSRKHDPRRVYRLPVGVHEEERQFEGGKKKQIVAKSAGTGGSLWTDVRLATVDDRWCTAKMNGRFALDFRQPGSRKNVGDMQPPVAFGRLDEMSPLGARPKNEVFDGGFRGGARVGRARVMPGRAGVPDRRNFGAKRPDSLSEPDYGVHVERAAVSGASGLVGFDVDGDLDLAVEEKRLKPRLAVTCRRAGECVDTASVS